MMINPAKLMFVTSLPNVSAQLLPLVFIALLIDALVVAVWYYLGVMLNNSAIKGSALGEFYQFLGTIVMIGIVVGTLIILSSAFYSTMGVTKLLSPSAVSTLCTNIESSTSLNILNKTNSLLSGPSSNTGNFVGICSLVQANGNTDLTSQLDYPLAAVSVIVANLTNQTAANFNSTYVVDAFLGFLSSVHPTLNVCLDVTHKGIACTVPNPFTSPNLDISLSFSPFGGLSMIQNDMVTFGTLLNVSTDSFVAQLLIISMFIYAWPYLLFVGFVLRSTFFTRKLGGLLIAIALGGLVIYPAAFAFEYLALGNGLNVNSSGYQNGLNSTYGYNALTPIPATNGNYVVNFFVEPNIKTIATTYNCWPNSILSTSHPLLGAEAADVAYLLVPGTSLISLFGLTGLYSFINQYVGTYLPKGLQSGNFYLPDECLPANALSTLYAILDSYGIIGTTSLFMPLMNLIITMSAIVGLSGLFGGDTQLAGLGRFL